MQIRRTSSVQNTNAANLSTRNKTASVNGQNAAPVDQLDFSAEAQALSQGNSASGIRMERVNELRAEIASGQYETAEKLDAAVSRMLDEIG